MQQSFFTARLKKIYPKAKVIGIDIAPTVINNAQKEYGHLGIEFKTYDIKDVSSISDKIGKGFDLVVMSDLMWYVIPQFKTLVGHLGSILNREGHFIINQTLYPPEKQKYGCDIVSSVENMLNLINYRKVEMIEVNRLDNHHAIILFQT